MCNNNIFNGGLFENNNIIFQKKIIAEKKYIYLKYKNYKNIILENKISAINFTKFKKLDLLGMLKNTSQLTDKEFDEFIINDNLLDNYMDLLYKNKRLIKKWAANNYLS